MNDRKISINSVFNRVYNTVSSVVEFLSSYERSSSGSVQLWGGLRGSGCLAAGACAPCSLCGAGARALRSLDLSKNNLHRILTGTVGSVF